MADTSIVRTIKTMNSLAKGGPRGNTVTEIRTQYNILFSTSLTDDQMLTILNSGAASGVFKRNPDPSLRTTYFYINAAMAAQNASNSVYLALAFQENPTVADPVDFSGTLPGRGPADNPEGIATSRGSVPFTTQGGLNNPEGSDVFTAVSAPQII